MFIQETTTCAPNAVRHRPLLRFILLNSDSKLASSRAMTDLDPALSILFEGSTLNASWTRKFSDCSPRLFRRDSAVTICNSWTALSKFGDSGVRCRHFQVVANPPLSCNFKVSGAAEINVRPTTLPLADGPSKSKRRVTARVHLSGKTGLRVRRPNCLKC